MKTIYILDTPKKVKIVFNHPFDWGFVSACRAEYISWDPINKERYLEFKLGTLPLKAERLIEDYSKTFGFYDKLVVDEFKQNFQLYLDSKNNVPQEYNKKKIDFDYYDDILKKEGMKLFDHQKAGISFLVNKGSAILADDMGLGKSLQTCITLLENKAKKVLIVAPLSARFVWRDELLKLDVKEEDIQIVEKEFRIKKYNIINYDRVKKFLSKINNTKFDYLILDEATYVKSRTAARTKVLLKIAKNCTNIIPITGTPLMNKPEELYTLLKLVKHPLGVNFTDFAKRYCGRKLVSFGARSYWETKGATNLDELSEKLKTIMIRRLEDDVLDLPEKIYTKYRIDLTDKQNKLYKEAEAGYLSFVKETKGYKLNKELLTQHLAKLSIMRQLCSDFKKEYTEKHIMDALEAGEKILVFGYYNKTLNELYEKYKDNALIITGKTKQSEREGIVKDFQNNPKFRIMFANMAAAGMALTLTAGTNAVFNDVYYNPAIHGQSEKRIHRIGQKHICKFFYPLFKDTIEEDIWEIIQKKKKLIAEVLKGTVRTFQDENVIELLIKQIYNKIGE